MIPDARGVGAPHLGPLACQPEPAPDTRKAHDSIADTRCTLAVFCHNGDFLAGKVSISEGLYDQDAAKIPTRPVAKVVVQNKREKIREELSFHTSCDSSCRLWQLASSGSQEHQRRSHQPSLWRRLRLERRRWLGQPLGLGHGPTSGASGQSTEGSSSRSSLQDRRQWGGRRRRWKGQPPAGMEMEKGWKGV